VSDEMADREHPAVEKLSAYQADELPSEEKDAIQEHVASCRLCTQRLLDLQQFLDFAPDPAREGVIDLETATEWRKLRRRIKRETEKKRFFASARGGYSVAAALLALSIGLAVWNLNLVRESRRPKPLSTMRTLEARESFRSGTVRSVEEPVSLPAQITLNLPIETPDPLYRIELLPHSNSRDGKTLELPPEGAELRFFLPEKALPSGTYTLRVRSLRGGQPSSTAWTYDLTIGP
jgi:putative zinc finger protein